MNYLHVSEDNISSGPALYFPCTNLNILFPNKHPSIHPKLLWIISSNSNNPLQSSSWLISIADDTAIPTSNPIHCLSLFATSAEDLPDSVIFSFTMNYNKTTWFLQSTFINILHINPCMASIHFRLKELNLPHCIYHTELEEFRRKHLTLLCFLLLITWFCY